MERCKRHVAVSQTKHFEKEMAMMANFFNLVVGNVLFLIKSGFLCSSGIVGEAFEALTL